MTMLASSNVHASCAMRGIMAYLDGPDGKRALARDFLNMTPREAARWDASMDRTRALAGHDKAWGGREPIRYYHFIVSPDPRDGVDIDTLRELATEWSRRLFGEHGEPGLLGCYQVAITYHDDNANRIPHAHVVVNCTNMANGRKMHIGRRDNEGLLPELLQGISKELGLSYFDDKEGEDRERRRRELSRGDAVLTSAERAMEAHLKYSWKQEMRDKIDIAKLTTRTEAELIAQLAATGILVRPSREDPEEWVYADVRNPYRLSCRAERLGERYSRAGVARYRDRLRSRDGRPLTAEEAGEHRAADAARARAAAEQRSRLRENVNRQVESATLVATFAGHVELERVVDALIANERHGIRCMADYDAALSRIERSLSLAPEGERAALRADLEQLRAARAVAEQGDLFQGVRPVRPLAPPPARKGGKTAAQKQREWRRKYAAGGAQRAGRGATRPAPGQNRPR